MIWQPVTMDDARLTGKEIDALFLVLNLCTQARHKGIFCDQVLDNELLETSSSWTVEVVSQRIETN